MAYFLKNGTSFTVSAKKNLDLYEQLPAGTYVIKKDIYENLFLDQIDDFVPAKKMYGNIEKQASRIFNTFTERPATTGVMLAGEKGSGKSLLAKQIAILGYSASVPTIVINTPWCGDKFNTFIQSIDQPTILLFDEFEKVYNRDEQEQILTLLDGVFPSKKLFMFTCNDKWRIDTHMRNRPGRIYYMLEFNGIESEFIHEYCEENLNNKEHITTLCNFSSVFPKFNFDMLKAIVEEMNRYNESPEEAVQWLNTKPEFGERQVYRVELTPKTFTAKNIDKTWEGNPLSSSITIEYLTFDDDWLGCQFCCADLVSVNSRTKTFIYENEHARLSLCQARESTYNYFNVM